MCTQFADRIAALVDPRYKIEQERSRQKSKETAMARDEQIAQNLRLLSKARPDIFGGDELKAEKKRGPPKSSVGGKDASGRVWALPMHRIRHLPNYKKNICDCSGLRGAFSLF